MSDAKLILILQRNLADAEVERLRLLDALDAERLRAAMFASGISAEREACAAFVDALLLPRGGVSSLGTALRERVRVTDLPGVTS